MKHNRAWVVVAGMAMALVAAVTSGGCTDGPRLDDEASSAAPETLGSEVADIDAVETLDEPDVEPTLDGSAASTAHVDPDIERLWSPVGGSEFDLPGERSHFVAVVPDGSDSSFIIGGNVTEFVESSVTATLWTGTDPANPELSMEALPTLASGVTSRLVGLRDVANVDDLADKSGISHIAAGSVGEGYDRRAAVWIREAGEWSQLKADGFLAIEPEWVDGLHVSPASELMVLTGTSYSGGVRRPMLWVSENGRDWTRVASPDVTDLPALTDLSASAITDDQGKTVMLLAASRQLSSGYHNVAMWRSVDGGGSWQAVSSPVFAGPQSVSVATLTGSTEVGFVAGGVYETDDQSVPASWLSVDGLSWEGPFFDFDVSDEERRTTHGFGVGQVVVQDGRFVAWADSDHMQHVWTSADGRSWREVHSVWTLEDFRTDVSDVAIVDGQLVAVTESGMMAVVASGSWERIEHDVAVVSQPERIPFIEDLAADSVGFVAVGGESFDVFTDSKLWRSKGPELWSSLTSHFGYRITDVVAHDDDVYMAGDGGTVRKLDWFNWTDITRYYDERPDIAEIAILDDTVYGFGIEWEEWELFSHVAEVDLGDSSVEVRDAVELDWGRPILWSMACASDERVVAGNIVDVDGRVTSALLEHSPGGAWNVVSAPGGTFDGVTNTLLFECTYGPDGFVAVGNAIDANQWDAGAWHSADGTQWSRIELTEDAVTGDRNESARSVTVYDGSYVVAGTLDVNGLNEPVVWIGRPGEWAIVPLGSVWLGMEATDVAVDTEGHVAVLGTRGEHTLVALARFEDLLDFGS